MEETQTQLVGGSRSSCWISDVMRLWETKPTAIILHHLGRISQWWQTSADSTLCCLLFKWLQSPAVYPPTWLRADLMEVSALDLLGVTRIRMAEKVTWDMLLMCRQWAVISTMWNNSQYHQVKKLKCSNTALKFRTGSKLYMSWMRIKRRRVGEERREDRIKRVPTVSNSEGRLCWDNFTPFALWQNNSGVTVNFTMTDEVINLRFIFRTLTQINL